MRYREPAICLRTADWSETSQVVCFLTRGCGVVRLVAKGAKRPKSKTGGRLDLMSEGDLVFTVKRESLGILIEFTESVARRTIRKDAARLYTALYALELASEALGEGDPHPEVFDLLHNALARWDQPDAPVPAVLAYYQWRLLRNVGLLGDMGACVSCGRAVTAGGGPRAGGVRFSAAGGGLLCGACRGDAEAVPVSAETLRGLAAVALAESGGKAELSDAQAGGINRLLAYHAAYQLGKPLKTARYAIAARGRG